MFHNCSMGEGTHSFRKSSVARRLSSYPYSPGEGLCKSQIFIFSNRFTLTQGSCSVQPLSTTTGPEPLRWDRPGLSSSLKGFSLVVTDGGESMSCSSPCPDNTSGDLGMLWKHKASGFCYKFPQNHLRPILTFNFQSLCLDPDFERNITVSLLPISTACSCLLQTHSTSLKHCHILLHTHFMTVSLWYKHQLFFELWVCFSCVIFRLPTVLGLYGKSLNKHKVAAGWCSVDPGSGLVNLEQYWLSQHMN